MLKRYPAAIFLAVLAVAVLVLAFLIWGPPSLSAPARTSAGTATLGSQTATARVLSVTQVNPAPGGGQSQSYEAMAVQILDGQYKGVKTVVNYYSQSSSPLAAGAEIYVELNLSPTGQLKANYTDYVRSQPLLILLLAFVLAMLAMGRWKGLGSLVALAFSMLVIVRYVIPHILAGEDPVRVSLTGAIILLAVTLYLTYGWNMKTHASAISMTLSLLLTGGLSSFFVFLTHLTGFGDENVMYLMTSFSVQIDPRGLLLGAMIIGAVGVLGDLVTSQSAAVVEIHDANPSLGVRETFQKAMRIGQDHVAATVNTLVLAYTGASLPLLLIFTVGNGNFTYFINSELLSEEIVRTLVGSLGLAAAVPISTIVATFLIVNQKRRESQSAQLGSEARSDAVAGPHQP
ncbi:MAG: YibE/F family protein [Anaerolineales bacterium]